VKSPYITLILNDIDRRIKNINDLRTDLVLECMQTWHKLSLT
ncbi:unnamed protein product, partial [Heterotrigona itama]